MTRKHVSRSTFLLACIVTTTGWADEPIPLAPVPALSGDAGQAAAPAVASDRARPLAAADESSPETSDAWTLEQLEELALAQNPAVLRAQAQVRAAQGNWRQVGLPPNPKVGYSGQQIGSRGLAEQDGVLIEQEFVRGGKLRLNRQIAASEIRRFEQEWMATRERVRTDVRMGAYHVMIAQRQLDVTNRLAKIAAEGLKSAETLHRAKEVGRADLLQAEIEVENANLLVRNTQLRYESSWRSLMAFVGQPHERPHAIVDRLEDAPAPVLWDETLSTLVTNSPEVARAMAEVDRARWVLQRARAEPIPNVTVQGLINARDNGIGGRSDGGLQVSLPLPTWNRNQGAIQQAGCELVAAQQALEQLERSLQQRLARVFERYTAAAQQVDRFRSRILPAAEESLELTRKSYEAGEIGFIGLLTAQRTYFQTNLSYLDSLREMRLAEAEIDGFLLQNSLETP